MHTVMVYIVSRILTGRCEMTFKEARESVGLTQDALAKLLNISRTTVAMWESGSSLPRADKLPKLAAIFGCTVDDLLNAKKGNSHGA